MTLEIGILFGLLAVMVFFFLTERLPVDLTAFAGLVVLIFAGYVKPEEAFAGFASPAVITMLAVFFVSAGLQYTGVAGAMGARIHRLVGDREVLLIAAIMAVGGILSAFMNNIAAAAVLMPAVASLARQAKIAPSRLMMPLAFGCILGGTTTLVGTPPNLLAAQVLEERQLRPFELFEFTPFGVALLAVGILFMVTVGRKLLPGGAGMADAERTDLASVYRLEERLFSITVPPKSPLDGCSLAEAGLSDLLGVQVVAIERDGREHLAPQPRETLRGGDRLVVEGRRDDLEGLLELGEVRLEELGSVRMGAACTPYCGMVVRLAEGSPWVGRSLRKLKLRKRHRIAAVRIWRDGSPVEERLADLALEPRDELLVLGAEQPIDELDARPDLEVLIEGPAAVDRVHGGLFVLRVPDGSPLAGTTIGETRLRERFDLTVVGIERDGEAELVVSPQDTIEAGDRLVVTGQPGPIRRLTELGDVALGEERIPRGLESDEVGMVEAVVAPRSAAVGRTLKELAFRKRYRLRALALWRNGRPIRSGLPDLPLRFGDGLLLHGRRERMALLESDPDFMVLSGDSPSGPHRPKQAPFALGALLLMVVLVVTGAFPIHVAAFAAATLVVLTRALRMQEAYRAVEWRAVFLVAAILPVGAAMERTGAAQLLADSVASVAGGAGPYAVLVALMILSSLLSQALDGAPTVVLLAPVVVGTAQRLGLSPYPLMMGVGLAASAAFMTPFSHKANLLVMGAGGYKAMDYVKVGSPLTVVVLAILAVMIPLLMPF
ncbi:MAG: SLC13 family permease [Deltaproteobacteria bacterium]|jgi:di/tricarboxylate transporter|nr:SLC13 family permease [Deltaproteobacteria bacterium]MBW2536276.1 SLC13 family permease [Deltaproteobacteria bacterium]